MSLFGSRVTTGAVWTFQAPAENQWIVLTGTLEGRTVDVSKSFPLRLSGPAGQSALVAVGPTSLNALDHGDTPAPIPPITISVEGKTAPAGAWIDMPIAAKGITRPGIYTGALDLSIATEPETIRHVRVEVVVGVKPIIEIPDKSIALSVSNCSRSGACAITEWLSPGATKQDTAVLTVINRTPAALVVEATGSLRGSTQASSVPFESGTDQPIAPNAYGPVRIPIARSTLLADHYSGTAIVTARAQGLPTNASVDGQGAVTVDNSSLTSVPFTVDVRAGALVPLIIVFLGVVAGRLSRYLNEPNRELRVALFSQRWHLREQIQALQDPVAQHHCQAQLDAIWAEVLSDNPADAKIRQDLSNLSTEIVLFAKLQTLRNEINSTPLAAADKTAIGQQLDTATQSLIADDLPTATTQLTAAARAIEQAITEANAANPGVITAVQVSNLREGSAGATAEVAAQKRLRGLRQSRWRMALAYLLQFLSGIDATQSIALQYWILRPLFFVGLIVAISLYGVWLQYSGVEHATFGSKGFTEYLGLFLWGFGAQVVAMNFQDIQFVRK
jgi:hypothetical protein